MSNQYHIITFYKFVQLSDIEVAQSRLKDFMLENDIKGTVLLAREGINATVAGSKVAIDSFIEFIKQDNRFSDIWFKFSYSDIRPFARTKVRLKKEAVRIGDEELPYIPGQYIKPEDWDAFTAHKDVITIDTRNDYEVLLGTFEGSINPKTAEFRTIGDWAETHLADTPKDTPIAMFCTGGIRCEKSTSLLRQKGFENVYHLEGGVLNYFDQTHNQNGKWIGSCFVFDDRISLDENLQPAKNLHCKACRQDIDVDDVRWGDVRINQKGITCLDCQGAD
jgi:UPF0176 protein